MLLFDRSEFRRTQCYGPLDDRARILHDEEQSHGAAAQ